ncbi:septum formation protein Maf [bacterium AH-315-P15]|nr:septum formation protein Maf [bacterium AH-315-P15]
MTEMRLILASASPARRAMLEGAELSFEVVPANVDEAALRTHLSHDGAALSEIAGLLAEYKAKSISRENPEALVIGADQLLVLGHEIFEKPKDMRAARETLQRLRGKTHELISAAALVRNGDCLWRTGDAARLTMRDFSADFLEDYLQDEGDAVLASVGAYRLEGRGSQLFRKIEGDYFTILGLPLLPLLGVLREAGVLET